MGSSASVSSCASTFDFQTAHGPGYENYTDDNYENATSTDIQKCEEKKLCWIFTSDSNSKQCNTDFRELESQFVRNLLRCEHELIRIPMSPSAPAPEMPKKYEKIEPPPAPVKKKEILEKYDENRSFVLLPSRSSHYFKNLILLGDPDVKYDDPCIDQKGGADLNLNPKSYVLPPDKLSKLKILSK